MKHGIPSISVRPHDRLALLRLVAALAVMLLAVLPHATLAASAFHASNSAPSSAMATSHGSHATHRQQTPTPCHEDDSKSGKASPSMPSCCILGCGLLGSVPVLDDKTLTTRWQLLSPAQVLALTEAMPEPAERPPRRALDRSII
jgi:hypothetical protein